MRASRTEWKKRVQQWQDSGLSVKEYAAKAEIALTQRQFRKGEGERSKAEQFLMQFSARQLAWDGAAARLRALYRTQHRLRIHESKLLPATTVEGDNDEET